MNGCELFPDLDDEEQWMVKEMEDYESKVEMSTRIIEITPHHLFRYASEWDPRKGNTKGGYLEGYINLPDRDCQIKIIIYPDEDLILQNDIRFNANHWAEFHPAVIHTVRKEKGNRRNCDKEPVPDVQHWIQDTIALVLQTKLEKN
eukprot:GFUD01036151.1.p1 GENE.GFUD01036151.1~~GFUD01036151.1.p1  ORF type:complete len:158 (-),score=21.07 GFUD01036151.1:270-707(-)